MRGGTLLALVAGGAAFAWWARRSLAKRDVVFLKRSSQVNHAEIALAHLALEQSREKAIHTYAQTLIRQHGEAQRELQWLGRLLGLGLPRHADAQQQEQAARLRQLSGHTFDRAFAEAMVSGHVRAIAMFDHEAANGKDPLVRAYARRVLPDLEEHLAMARRLEHQLRHPAAT